MPEWSIGSDSKSEVLARGPRVRIPLSPYNTLFYASQPPDSYPLRYTPLHGSDPILILRMALSINLV